MVVGAALQCSAFTLGHFIAGRVITGFGKDSVPAAYQLFAYRDHR